MSHHVDPEHVHIHVHIEADDPFEAILTRLTEDAIVCEDRNVPPHLVPGVCAHVIRYVKQGVQKRMEGLRDPDYKTIGNHVYVPNAVFYEHSLDGIGMAWIHEVLDKTGAQYYCGHAYASRRMYGLWIFDRRALQTILGSGHKGRLTRFFKRRGELDHPLLPTTLEQARKTVDPSYGL